MEKLVEIIADEKRLSVSPGISVLKALRDCGIDIPGLCYHPSLGVYGGCGLCMVEIWSTDDWKPQHACLLEVAEGLQIKTDTPRLRIFRSWAAKILLRRRPFLNQEVEKLLLRIVNNEAVQNQKDENLVKCIEVLSSNLMEGCILCGLCIRMCSKINRNRLTFLGRGNNLRIGFVPGEDNKFSCGNCHACRNICPTGFITPDAEHAFKARFYKD